SQLSQICLSLLTPTDLGGLSHDRRFNRLKDEGAVAHLSASIASRTLVFPSHGSAPTHSKVVYMVAAGDALFKPNSAATACSTTVSLKKPGLLRVCSIAALENVN